MIYTHKHRLVRTDGHGDHGLIETDDRLGESVQRQFFTNVQAINNLALLRHERYEEFTIVLICNHKDASSVVLLYDVDFHVVTLELMAENAFIGAKTVAMDFE